MRERFERAAHRVDASCRAGEDWAVHFTAEESGFVRWNHAQIRQAGQVTQAYLTIDLRRGRRHAAGTLTLGDEDDWNGARIGRLLDELRVSLDAVPEDPWLRVPDEVVSTDETRDGSLPRADQVVEVIGAAARDLDLVGILACGPVHEAFADSRGQRNWHTVPYFHFDWSVYLEGDKAVKSAYAGTSWSDAELVARVRRSAAALDWLARPPVRIGRGQHRVYLSPAAVGEILGTVSWGGFSLRAQRTGFSGLARLVAGETALDPRITIAEEVGSGIAARFSESGFLRPDRVPLIEGGLHAGALVSPRSAMEYGVRGNGAGADESPRSLGMAAGDLPEAEVLGRLGEGVIVGHLHYVNHSDRRACRLTGNTRFATGVVRGGEVVGPLEVMRFDETLDRMLGSGLVALTRERERRIDPGTYGRRSTSSVVVPGALIDGFRFTS